MAQRGVQLDEETISCPICLDPLDNPVTVPCGHNYCMDCIKAHWDEEDRKGIHSCPQCRKTFKSRPVLQKNILLAVLVEELRKAGVQAAPADHCYAGPEDVACDVCTGRKLKATQSCLVCQASYCEKHLQPHYESPAFKKHALVEASVKKQNISSRHEEAVSMKSKHKGHETVSAGAARAERQKELRGQNFTSTDLSRLNLSGINSKMAMLRVSNHIHTTLGGVNWTHSNMAGNHLIHFNVGGVNLTSSNTAGNHLFNIDVGGVSLTCNKPSAKPNNCNVRGAALAGTNQQGQNFAGADLSHLNLQSINFKMANLSGANLTHTNLTGAQLTMANLSGADLTHTNLTGAKVTMANLSGADLTRANLSGTNLTMTNLHGANLTGANLSGANLKRANLCMTCLDNCNLTGCDLRKANLRGSTMT